MPNSWLSQLRNNMRWATPDQCVGDASRLYVSPTCALTDNKSRMQQIGKQPRRHPGAANALDRQALGSWCQDSVSVILVLELTAVPQA